MRSPRPLRITVVGTFDPAYPRNRQILRLLETLRHDVVIHHIGLWGSTRFDALDTGMFGKFKLAARIGVSQLRGFVKILTMRRPDVVMVLFPGQLDMLAVGLAARLRRIPVVFEYFISLHETMVTDRQLVPPSGLIGRVLGAVDRAAARLATVLLADTAPDAQQIVSDTHINPQSVVVLPIAPDPGNFNPLRVADVAVVGGLVLFYGTFIPLHGIDTILAAAAHPSCAGLQFRVLGRGQLRDDMEKLAEDMRVAVDFAEPVPESALAGEIARAEICLGVFGTSDKAQRVTPNKVLECLAVGRPVITADTPGVAGLTEALVTVPPGDPETLALAITGLVGDRKRQEELVAAGHRVLAESYGDGELAGLLAGALSRAVLGVPGGSGSVPSDAPRRRARRRRGHV